VPSAILPLEQEVVSHLDVEGAEISVQNELQILNVAAGHFDASIAVCIGPIVVGPEVDLALDLDFDVIKLIIVIVARLETLSGPAIGASNLDCVGCYRHALVIGILV
jgi:hypothetical protein